MEIAPPDQTADLWSDEKRWCENIFWDVSDFQSNLKKILQFDRTRNRKNKSNKTKMSSSSSWGEEPSRCLINLWSVYKELDGKNSQKNPRIRKGD